IAPISGVTSCRSSMRMRPTTVEFAASEGIPERELNQARVADGRHDLAEGGRALCKSSVRPAIADTGRVAEGSFHVGAGRVGEIRVIPDVEEIRRETKLLAFRDRKILDQRKVPILLERTAVEVPTHISERGGTRDRIG